MVRTSSRLVKKKTRASKQMAARAIQTNSKQKKSTPLPKPVAAKKIQKKTKKTLANILVLEDVYVCEACDKRHKILRTWSAMVKSFKNHWKKFHGVEKLALHQVKITVNDERGRVKISHKECKEMIKKYNAIKYPPKEDDNDDRVVGPSPIGIDFPEPEKRPRFDDYGNREPNWMPFVIIGRFYVCIHEKCKEQKKVYHWMVLEYEDQIEMLKKHWKKCHKGAFDEDCLEIYCRMDRQYWRSVSQLKFFKWFQPKYTDRPSMTFELYMKRQIDNTRYH